MNPPAGDATAPGAPHAATWSQLPPGCPTPIEWQDVLRDFHKQADAWYLDRPGYRLSGRTWGEGPPLYFLNGIGGDLELFALLVFLLKDQFRCVLYNYPGTDKRIRLKGVSLRDFAADFWAVADQCGDAAPFLFGTSFGGLVGLETLLARPGRIPRAILQGGFAHRKLSVFERLLIRVCRFHRGRMRNLPLHQLIQKQSHFPWFPKVDSTRWEFFNEVSGRVPVATVAHSAGLIRDADLRPVLAGIQTPILLVRTEGDGAVPAECQEILERGLPNGRIEWIHSAGHLPYLTHPHRMAKIVREFLLPVEG